MPALTPTELRPASTAAYNCIKSIVQQFRMINFRIKASFEQASASHKPHQQRSSTVGGKRGIKSTEKSTKHGAVTFDLTMSLSSGRIKRNTTKSTYDGPYLLPKWVSAWHRQ